MMDAKGTALGFVDKREIVILGGAEVGAAVSEPVREPLREVTETGVDVMVEDGSEELGLGLEEA